MVKKDTEVKKDSKPVEKDTKAIKSYNKKNVEDMKLTQEKPKKDKKKQK